MMFGKIIYMNNSTAHIEINGFNIQSNIMNLHVIFEDNGRKILGEIEDLDDKVIKVHFLGEIINDKFSSGVVMKPSLNSSIRLIRPEELKYIVGVENSSSVFFGYSPLYNAKIFVDINDLFSNHMAIFGNTGSGKSYGVAKLLQSVFENPQVSATKSNFFIFDAYGEYHNSFSKLSMVNPNYNFKYYTTNLNDTDGQVLRIPLWLLNIDDVALLLQADSHVQLPIIESMIRHVNIFCENSEQSIKYKNHLIARAIMTILYSNQPSISKRDDIFSILSTCSTEEFNTESIVSGIGYTRKFRECFQMNKDGSFAEELLVFDYISSFIHDELDNYEPSKTNFYTLKDMENALDFTMISEGMFQNSKMYNEAMTLKVRLHSLLSSNASTYFSYPQYISLENYVSSLVFSKDGKKTQVINFNLEDIDDTLAKSITKIYTRMLFEFTKRLNVRASVPFHIFLEEAHRYVQKDSDIYMLGYNIFERVAKEGRKYGLILNLITQRPVELSETVISQCSNYMIFKINNPKDLTYIREMLPNINAEIIEKQKTLQPGTCVAFGRAFKVPLIIRMDMPNPEPQSTNCDVLNRWK